MIERINWLRRIGIAEGISFMVLVLIAMPMKYLMGIPEAVKFVGWAHGVLFMAYIVVVWFAKDAMKWSWFSVLVAWAASLIPIGTFLLDRQWKKRLDELKR